MTTPAAEVIRQLAILAKSVEHIRKDIVTVREAIVEDKEEYKGEIVALRGDLATFFYEQSKQGKEILLLKKRLNHWPIDYSQWLPKQ